MQTSLETLSSLERRLSVSLPSHEIDHEINYRLKRLQKTVKMPGFRPGKVPFNVVVKQYGDQIRSDVLGDKVKQSLDVALREQNLRIAGYPRIEPKAGDSNRELFEYAATFEIYPEVQLGDLSTIVIKKPVATVAEEDVDRTIEVLRKQRVTYRSIERPAQTEDQITADFVGTVDDQEFPGGKAENFVVVVGAGRMLPEFEAAIVGVLPGDQKSFDLTFPADYHAKDLAGKKAVFSLQVKAVKEPILPPLDADFARALGVESGDLGAFRQEILDNLNLELKRRVEADLRNKVMKALVEATTLEVPNSLVMMEVQRMTQAAGDDLRAKGLDAGQLKPEMFRQRAYEQTRLGLVVGEIIRLNGLEVSSDQVRLLVEEYAQSFEDAQEVVKWHHQNPERLLNFQAQAMEKNVVDWVLLRAKVEDDPTTFAALIGVSS